MRNILSVLFLLALFTSCSSEAEFSGFDFEAWRRDRQACKGIRDTMYASLERIRPQLKGKTESGLVNLLGTPDRNELDGRNRKHLIYFITKGSQCNNRTATDSLGWKIRFSTSAMNVVNEALIEKE